MMRSRRTANTSLLADSPTTTRGKVTTLPLYADDDIEKFFDDDDEEYNHKNKPKDNNNCCGQWRRLFLGTTIFALLFLATNVTVDSSVLRLLGVESRDLESPAPVKKKKQKRPVPVRKWAYTFFLGGVPTIRNNETALSQAGYKGMLYNILVSAQILREAGTKADLILMVHMAEPYESLPAEDTRMLQKLNITTHYVPPTLPSYINGMSTIAMEKFRILNLLDYSRVIYLEGDVMPHCNLDYLFELSEPPVQLTESDGDNNNNNNNNNKATATLTQQPILQENVILSIQGIPATSSIFMLRPWRGHYERLLRVFTDYPDFFEQFNQTRGWGHRFNAKKGDTWLSVADLLSVKKKQKVRDRWNFHGANLDRGLLYHWVRYIRKKVSVVVGPKMVTITGNDHKIGVNPLRKYSCLPANEEEEGKGYQWYANADQKKLSTPLGQAPYRDFAQWEHNDNKPWNYKLAPGSGLNITSARRRWFQVLRQLDQQHKLKLGLYDPKTAAPKHNGEHLRADAPNWKYVPRQNPSELMPIWSTKFHALKQWAKQQTDYEARSHLWQQHPPLLTLPPDAHRQHLFSQPSKSSTTPKSKKGASIQPMTCNCSAPITVDPCSVPGQSIEGWLESRVGLEFSKHSPACPGGARHHMHIVVPFANLKLDMIQDAYCSVQCQDYPTHKMTIYVYEDGAEATTTTTKRDGGKTKKKKKAPAASPPSQVLQHICGEEGILEVKPPVPAFKMASNPKTDEEFDEMSQKWATKTMKGYKKNIEPKTKETVAANTVCLHSNEHSGPGGGKYWAFRLVQAKAQANDVVVVLDGDDELNTPKALQIINKRYVDKSAWMTYGSYTGKYADQTKGLPRAVLEGKSAFNPRKDSPSWRFGHTRTFKAHLLPHVGRKDFAFKDNSWLVKATDRGFVYRMLELSGPDRVEFIDEPLYKYKWSASSSTVASIPKEVRVANLQHVQSLAPSKRMSLPIHIVIVCWSRVYLLKDQLIWLQEQTLAKNRQLVVHLLSNNPETHPDVVQSAELFRKKQQGGSFPNKVKLQVKVVQQEQNWHAFSRFLYINELRKTEPMDLAIFVDDDQYWVPNFLSSLLSYHKPRGMTTWYGKTFSGKDAITGKADYWSSDITWSDIAWKNKTEISTFTYGGPGGSVFDSNIWLFDQQLLRLRDDLQRYYEFDDVWVSYVVDALLGWEHRRLPFPLPVDIANIDHPANSAKILPSLPKGQADKLLQMNRDMAATMKAVATYSGTARGTKTDMFLDMQKQFHWDVLRPNSLPVVSKSPKSDVVVESSKQIGFPVVLPRKLHKTGPKRAFVCITGQFARLELQNKIENLLLPMTRDGYKVQVALVLTGGNTTFTNEGYSKLAKYQPTEKVPFYKTIPDAVEELQKHKLNVVSPRDTAHGTYEKLADPKIHQQYLMALYKIQEGDRSFEAQKERVKNHPRIYESYQRCLAYADKAVAHANAKVIEKKPQLADDPPYTLQNYYDVFFRVREDVGFQEKLSKKMMTSLLEPPSNSVTVTGCRGWHGMNDRFASVSSDVARTYFQRPYDIFQKEEHLRDQVVYNPETFLLYSYLSAGINVFANRALKGVNRIYKNPKTGQATFHQDDLKFDWCMKPQNHTDHVVSLYGLSLND